MAYTQQLLYEPLRSVDTSTLSGSYVPLGTALAYPASIVKLVNNSTVPVTVSTDGINDMDIAPTDSFFLYDVTTNGPSNGGDDGIFIPQGTQYLISGSAGTGLVYLVVQYIKRV